MRLSASQDVGADLAAPIGMRPSDYSRDTSGRTAAWLAPVSRRATDVTDTYMRWLDDIPQGGRILDVGCQSGHVLAKLRETTTGELYGLDIGDYSACWSLIGGVHFAVHDVDAAPLPFDDAHFTTVLCLNVLEHVFDCYGLVSELSRVLEPGGHAIIDIPNIAYIKHVLSLLRGRAPRTGARYFPFRREEGWDGQHLHNFALRDVRELLSMYGLRIRRVRVSGRLAALRECLPSLFCANLGIIAQKDTA